MTTTVKARHLNADHIDHRITVTDPADGTKITGTLGSITHDAPDAVGNTAIVMYAAGARITPVLDRDQTIDIH